MSRALLLLTTGLTMGATRVVPSSNVLPPPGLVARALAGPGAGTGVSPSSEDEVSTSSRSTYSSSGGARWMGERWTGARWTGARWTGAGWTGAGWTGARWAGARWSAGLVREWDAILGCVLKIAEFLPLYIHLITISV